MNFRIEQWGGCNKKLLDMIEREYHMAAKHALGVKFRNKSDRQRLTELQWLPLRDEILLATHKATYKILNDKIPLKMFMMMPMNMTHRRIQAQKKLAVKPRILNKNKLTRSMFCSHTYVYNTLPAALTLIDKSCSFKTQLKAHMLANQR